MKEDWTSVASNILAGSNSLIPRFHYVIIEAYQHENVTNGPGKMKWMEEGERVSPA